jgi:hypothetical protein
MSQTVKLSEKERQEVILKRALQERKLEQSMRRSNDDGGSGPDNEDDIQARLRRSRELDQQKRNQFTSLSRPRFPF